ncbi:MAG: NAD-dependent epimerase/dehydratase family protein [Marinilabiliaceae bacterium]|nr:NAD-dependent epimerase/dehydratase family protein [Marinilabiliaceae bacterium]
MRGKKVLVTGGTGLVGSHLIYHLAKKGYSIKAIKRKESSTNIVNQIISFYEKESNISPITNNIEWVEGDITDYYSIIDALENVNHVYHAAAYVSFNPRKKSQVFKINTEGTTNMVNACLETGIEKFCHISSIGALGTTTDNKPVTEESNWHVHKKRSNYSQSKFDAEMEVWRAAKEGLPVIIVNPGVIIGPCPLNRSTGSLFALGKNGYRLYPSGSNTFVDVRDVAEASILLMESNVFEERYIVAGETIRFKELLNILATAMNVAKPTHKAPKWLAEVAWRLERLRSLIITNEPLLTNESTRASYSNSNYSSNKLIEQFNFQFRPIEQAINETWRWYTYIEKQKKM